jgi:hypothetical protein
MPDARLCARREHCGDAQPDENGLVSARAKPGLPFCARCVGAIGRALAAMPQRHAWLRARIGEFPARAARVWVSGTRDPRCAVIRLDVEALTRDMTETLCGWEERVADAEGLHRPGTALSRRRREKVALAGAVSTLGIPERLEVLLGLPPAPMARYVPLTRRMTAPPPGVTGWVHKTAGYMVINEDRSGADAGLDILSLSWQARRLLGEVIPPPERLDGVPCRACGALALEACAEPEYRSWCAQCGDLLTPGEYLDWIRLYAARVRRQVAAGELEPADPAGYERAAA